MSYASAEKNADTNTQNGDNGFLPSKNIIYPKSNVLISAKYKSTILENKIMAYSLAHASQFDYGKSDRETIRSTMHVSELRKLLGGNRGSFYHKLNQTAQNMTGRSVGMRSPDGKTFDYIAIVTRATCENGYFTIEYNGAIRSILSNLQKDYSKLNLAIQLRFNNVYSYRLYEILKMQCFHSKDDTTSDPDVFHIRMDLAELKLQIGVVNAELDTVKRILKNQENPDYAKAVAASPERMFDAWYDFRRSVLDKAMIEINEKSDLFVEYEPLRHGSGGKVVGIDFTVTRVHNAVFDEVSFLTDDEKLDRLIELRAFTEKRFSTRELEAIAEAAKWNVKTVEDAYELLQTQKDIRNPVGWMLQAVKERYGAPQNKRKKTSGSSPKKKTKRNSFTDFEQREYDFDVLEKSLLGAD